MRKAKVQLACSVALLLLAVGHAQAGLMIVPIRSRSSATPNMTCPYGEYVSGFLNGVPLCTNWESSVRVVFVTSNTVTGAIGGLAAADTICQNEANAAGLLGTYIAFLSNSVNPGSTIDLINNNPASLKYIRPDSTTVANSTAEFLSTTHLAPISLTASGTTITGDARVWTGYINDNGTITPNQNCSDWTDATPWTAGGANGIATETDARWFHDYGTYCTEYHHFYCVQVMTGAGRE